MLHLPAQKKKQVLVAVYNLADENGLMEYETLINTPDIEIVEEERSITPKGQILVVVKYTVRKITSHDS